MTETTQRLYHGSPLQPYSIGVLVDLPDYPGLSDAFPDMIRFALAEARARGIVEREIEVVHREVKATPWTDARPLIAAYRSLVADEGVLAVAGPMTSDNCLPLLPETRRMRMPTVTICGSLQWRGRFAFSLANGGLADEPAIMAAWLSGEGHRRVAVVRETTHVGEEYAGFFRMACRERGIAICAEAPVYAVASQAELTELLLRCKDAKPDALVYLGIGALNQVFRAALEHAEWDPPRIQTTAFVSAAYSKDRAERLEGWVGVDQYDERNQVFAAVLDRFEQAYGYRPANSGASCGYDIGHVIALAIGRMRLATPQSVAEALETIRRLPACTGGPGTTITFGPGDHRGFKGPDFLVLRSARDGTTSLIGGAPVEPWEQPDPTGPQHT